MTKPIHDQAKAQFARTAEGYVSSPGHAKGAELQRMLELAGELRVHIRGARVLDVATGGGHTALAFARAGAKVTATDLTRQMLQAAERFVVSELGAEGRVRFQEAAAEALPFADAAFDIVTCRIAAHHFAEPGAFVAEAERVLEPGGLLMLVDNIAPEDPGLAEAMNRIEMLRDPSHVRAYSVRQWMEWLAGRGLESMHLSRWHRRKEYRDWLQRAHTPPEEGERIERYVLGLPEAYRRYFRVELEGGRLYALAHEAVLIVVQKLAV